MNARFYLILLLLSILFGGWTYLAHNHGVFVEKCYEDLAQLPVYAYVADTTSVTPIMEGLGRISDVATIEHETGFQAAMELIGAYGLPLTESTVADYQFPDLITITFPAQKAGIAAKTRVMDLLRTYVREDDLDSQSNAYSKVIAELKRLGHRNLVFNIFAGLLMFLVFIFSRLSYEMHIYLKQKRKLISVVDVMRHNKLNAAHSWTMLIVPAGLASGLYYLGVYLNRWHSLASWWSFATMGGLSLVATLIIFFNLKAYEHDLVLQNAEPVVVVTPSAEEDSDA
jgi:hypothetical protein